MGKSLGDKRVHLDQAGNWTKPTQQCKAGQHQAKAVAEQFDRKKSA
jgi:hypothetical protein